MDELIKRSDAIKALHEEWDGCLVVDESGEWIARECEKVLYGVPSAQKWIPCIEIVRCKDCDHVDFGGCANNTCYCLKHGCYMDADDYCNHGEKDE